MQKARKTRTGLHNRINRHLAGVLSLILACITLSGCGMGGPDAAGTGTDIQVYYITSDIDGLTPISSGIEAGSYDSTEALLGAVTDALATSPEATLRAPLRAENGFKTARIVDNQVVLDFNENLTSLDVISRTLIMAAATRTITQIKGIDAVSGTIEGAPMLDSAGMVIGPMSADAYVDNAGLQINAEERTQLTLYFANETGDGLVKVNRTVVYSGNIPMDKLVMQQLINGPLEGENAHPVMNPSCKLINATTQDGTCYVNLDSAFLSPVDNISNDVAIYSIVDSLAELGTVNKVQFLIDSDSDVMFREAVSLNTQFDRNLDIVEE